MKQFVSKAVVLLLGGIGCSVALPCSLSGLLPTPEELVDAAEVIVHVRAMGVADNPDRQPGPASSDKLVEFQVLRVLKGELSQRVLAVPGLIVSRDDYNDSPAPYSFIRPGGRSGSCFALEYRLGSQYLLLLAESPEAPQWMGKLTPYWSPLAPTNEQVRHSQDPWVVWVSDLLSARD